MTDLKELIEQEIDQYLEWPTADKSHVTTVSAKLFAEHVARLYADHIADARKKASRPQIREVFMRNGARIEPGRDDLPDYVYESVFELLDSVIQQAGPAVQGEPVAWVHPEQLNALTRAQDTSATCSVWNVPGAMPSGTSLRVPLYAAPQPAEETACPMCNGEGLNPLTEVPVPCENCHGEQHPADSADVRQDKQCRQDVAAALGFPCGGNYAWSYLLQQIKDAVSTGEKQPDVTQLVKIAKDIVDLHDRRRVVLTVHVEALREALADYLKGVEP